MPKKNDNGKSSTKKRITLNPQQADFFTRYSDPRSDTFGNLKQSALEANFGKKYSEDISSKRPKWFTDWIEVFGGHLKRLEKAEKVFDDILDTGHIVDAMGPFGPIINKKTNKPYQRVSTSILKLKGDTAEFLAETVGRSQYSKKVNVKAIGDFNPDSLKDYA